MCRVIDMSLISFFSACGHSVFPALFLEDDIFSLVYVLLPLCQISGIVLMFESSVFFHYFTSLFFPISYCIYYYSFLIDLEVWNGNLSNTVLFVQYCFGYPGSLGFNVA